MGPCQTRLARAQPKSLPSVSSQLATGGTDPTSPHEQLQPQSSAPGSDAKEAEARRAGFLLGGGGAAAAIVWRPGAAPWR